MMTDLIALLLVIDIERERILRWHTENYVGPADASRYAREVMDSFARIVEARDQVEVTFERMAAQ